MKIIDAAIAAIPHSCAAIFVHRDVIVVNYHLIAPESPKHITGILPNKTPAQFEQDLLFLKRHYNVVSYADVLVARNGGSPLPKRAMMISFDDGFRECYDHVMPLLLKHELPCTFFLITNSVDNRALAYPNRAALCLDATRSVDEKALSDAHAAIVSQKIESGKCREDLFRTIRGLTIRDVSVLDALEAALGIDTAAYLSEHSPYLTLDQIQKMRKDGFAFGAHTKTHPQLWLVDEDRLETELAESCKAVCSITGETTAPFAFPYRSNGISRDRLAAIRERHPQIGLLFDTHGYVRDAEFMVPRLTFDDPAGAGESGSNLSAGLNRGYIAQAAKTMLGRGQMG
jgi:peptidoglycan/xylan/chitin deacetylase (PgdA/CDA1 family)